MSNQIKQQAFDELAFIQPPDVDRQGLLDSQEDGILHPDQNFAWLPYPLSISIFSPAPGEPSPVPSAASVITLDAGDLTILKNASALLQQDDVKLVSA
jgi:hypothetical protein